ncbi:metal-dependent transcriptional regulator [Eisenbergiella tayi]|uniref:metal-dependent transcriptional regulator n=1 Tax=Eisenbergiella tayi TaxID=1432052 RepID=UPI0032C049DA
MKKVKHATAAGEDYLEAVLVLQQEKGMVRSVDVARHMGVSKPSVCHAVATLKEGGFLTMDEDFFLRLTDVGKEVAEKTYEKHCFFMRLLVDAGVEPRIAEQDACRMEHVISESSFRHLKRSVGKKE